MRILRGALGALLWILAALVGLVAAVLCVTVVLLPLGIPLLLLSRRLFRFAVKLMLPRSVTHPAQELGKKLRKTGRKDASNPGVPAEVADALKRTSGFTRRARKRVGGRRHQLLGR